MYVRHNLCLTQSIHETEIITECCIGRLFKINCSLNEHQYKAGVVLLKWISFVCMFAHAHTANEERFLLNKDL